MANGGLRHKRTAHLDERRLKGAADLTNKMRHHQAQAQAELGGHDEAVAVRWLHPPDCDPAQGPGYYALENGSGALLMGYTKEQAERCVQRFGARIRKQIRKRSATVHHGRAMEASGRVLELIKAVADVVPK